MNRSSLVIGLAALKLACSEGQTGELISPDTSSEVSADSKNPPAYECRFPDIEGAPQSIKEFCFDVRDKATHTVVESIGDFEIDMQTGIAIDPDKVFESTDEFAVFKPRPEGLFPNAKSSFDKVTDVRFRDIETFQQDPNVHIGIATQCATQGTESTTLWTCRSVTAVLSQSPRQLVMKKGTLTELDIKEKSANPEESSIKFHMEVPPDQQPPAVAEAIFTPDASGACALKVIKDSIPSGSIVFPQEGTCGCTCEDLIAFSGALVRDVVLKDIQLKETEKK